MLADPFSVTAISLAAEFAFDIVKEYAAEKVVELLKRENSPAKEIFIGSIHADVVNIVNRVDNIGGCESIEIGAPGYRPKEMIEFDARARDYVRSLGYEHFLGRSQELVGDVFKLYPNIGMVEVRRIKGKKKCKVFFTDPRDFERVRFSKNPAPRIRVYGRPRHRLGTEGKAFNEFEGQGLEGIDDAT